MIFLLAFVGTFISVFVKGFQHKNVNHDLRWHIAVTSYVMNVMELLLIGGYAKIIIDGNYWYAFVSGFAAAGGMISSIMFHDYFVLKKRKENGKRPRVYFQKIRNAFARRSSAADTTPLP